MSSFLSQARARALRPASSLPRPRLTVVPRLATRAPRVPFVLLVITILSAGLVGLLLVNTSLQRGAYVATDLRGDSSALSTREQKLELQVAALQEPQRVAQQAQRLGMVQNDSPAFLSLSTGQIIGKPVPGVAGNRVDVSPAHPVGTEHASKIIILPDGNRASQTSGAILVPRDRGGNPGSGPRGERQ